MRTPVIDLHDYLDMDLVDKLIVLRNNGVPIGRVETKLLRSELHALGGFYVEVRTSLTGQEERIDAVPFLKGPRLDKYLETVDLSSLSLS